MILLVVTFTLAVRVQYNIRTALAFKLMVIRAVYAALALSLKLAVVEVVCTTLSNAPAVSVCAGLFLVLMVAFVFALTVGLVVA